MEYRTLLKSELKQNILLSLLEGDRKLSELKVDLASSETTILHALKDLGNIKLTARSGGIYSLTPLGVIEARITKEYFNATRTLEKFQDFWYMHDSQSLSLNSILSLGMLYESELVNTDSTELGRVHNNFLNLIKSSKKIKGLSPIFHTDYFSVSKSVLNNGGNIDLILNSEVLNKTLEQVNFNKDTSLFEKYIKNGQLKVFLADNIKIALTVTECVFSMGLFYPNGQYDYSTDLISSNQQALQWGEGVFLEYLKHGTRLQL